MNQWFTQEQDAALDVLDTVRRSAATPGLPIRSATVI